MDPIIEILFKRAIGLEEVCIGAALADFAGDPYVQETAALMRAAALTPQRHLST